VSSTTQEDIQKAQHKKNATKPGDAQAESEHESDVHVIGRAVYRSNDEGYLDPKHHAHIWLLEVPTTSEELPKPVQLTNWKQDSFFSSFTTSNCFTCTELFRSPSVST